MATEEEARFSKFAIVYHTLSEIFKPLILLNNKQS